MVIKVLQYDTYQSVGNYESDTKSEINAKQKRNRSDTISKEIKKDKNIKNSIYIPSFNLFWNLYPNKKGKKVANQVWGKIDSKLYPTIMVSLKAHTECADWLKDDGQFIPHPTTWLRGERWEDIVKSVKPKKNTSFQDKYGKYL